MYVCMYICMYECMYVRLFKEFHFEERITIFDLTYPSVVMNGVMMKYP